jgi:hypothetical protein
MIGRIPLKWWKHFDVISWLLVIALVAFAATASAAQIDDPGAKNASIQQKITPFQDRKAAPTLQDYAFEKQNPYKKWVRIEVFVFNTGMPDAYSGTLIVHGVGGGAKATIQIPFR